MTQEPAAAAPNQAEVTGEAGERMTSRQRTEERERTMLAPWASRSAQTRGRELELGPDDLRTEYQRDRDRILHAKSFRRLAHKTQVFLAPEGDHYRTRLTHTLEVAQISRTVARALMLNEDLTEAIALGHDLGHTPFGHVGEDALTECLARSVGRYPGIPTSFHHHLQSLRVVEVLEYEGKGLNLTWEVRDGIAHHSVSGPEPETAEGCVVRLADKIAYVSHDLDDAERAGVVAVDDVPPQVLEALGRHHGVRLNTMVIDLVANSDEGRVEMSAEVNDAMMALRDFLHGRVYVDSEAKRENPKAIRVLSQLFDYFMDHIDEVPAEYVLDASVAPPVQVSDFISGMTDRYAIGTFMRLFVPRPWAPEHVEDSD